MSKYAYLLLILSIFIYGCSNPYRSDDANLYERSGRYNFLDYNEVKVFSPINNLDEQKLNLLINYLNVPVASEKEYDQFMYESLNSMGLNNVLHYEDLNHYLAKKKIYGESYNLTNNNDLDKLAVKIGSFLVITTDLEYLQNGWWEFNITVYDPITSTIKYSAGRRAITWSSVNHSHLIPVFNDLKRWVDTSIIETRKANNQKNKPEKLI